MPSPTLYSQQPRSEPSDSSGDENGDEDDDGFISRTPLRHARSFSRSASPPSKRTRRAENTAPESSVKYQSSNGGFQQDFETPTELSMSILHVEPMDEFIRYISDFIHSTVLNANVQPPVAVEIEAKIGMLRDRRTRERIAFPSVTETIMPPSFDDYTFESNISLEQHKHFNNMLNKLAVEPPAPTTPTGPRPSKIQYSHRHLIDEFYGADTPGRPAVGRERIRVTRDAKTNQVVECVRKVRLGDLNVYSPKWRADWRISVNLEVPERPPSGAFMFSRKKDRMTYTHETTRIDLTQVTQQGTGDAPSVVLHELEVEMIPPSLVMNLVHERGRDSREPKLVLDEAVRVLVNNTRILVRNA